MRVHDGLVKLTGTSAVRFFYDVFGGRTKHSEQAPMRADLSGVGAVTLTGRRRVKPVDCAANVLPLRYFDTIGEDLNGQRVVGNFFSIGIQLRWGWIAGRSHLLCSFPLSVWERQIIYKTALLFQETNLKTSATTYFFFNWHFFFWIMQIVCIKETPGFKRKYHGNTLVVKSGHHV